MAQYNKPPAPLRHTAAPPLGRAAHAAPTVPPGYVFYICISARRRRRPQRGSRGRPRAPARLS
eukprot:6743035-Prymnesium_polylepis.1